MIKCGCEMIMDSVVDLEQPAAGESEKQVERGVQCVIKRRSVPEGDRES
jgi:hypothetical protein